MRWRHGIDACNRRAGAGCGLGPFALADPTQLYRAVGMELAQTMGGSSGVLLAIFFAAAAMLGGGKPWVGALSAGLGPGNAGGRSGPGHRTMIDALAPALASLPQGIVAAAAAARAGADGTAAMTRARAGRASYLSPDKLAGFNDPGAEGVARLFEDLARGLKGQRAIVTQAPLRREDRTQASTKATPSSPSRMPGNVTSPRRAARAPRDNRPRHFGIDVGEPFQIALRVAGGDTADPRRRLAPRPRPRA